MAVTAEGDVAAPGAGAGVAGGADVGYAIDRDGIPAVVADLRRALASLEDAAREAERHGHVVSPGGDPYSPGAAREMGAHLVENYLAANERDRQNVQAVIDNLDTAMRDYDSTDDAAALSLRGTVS